MSLILSRTRLSLHVITISVCNFFLGRKVLEFLKKGYQANLKCDELLIDLEVVDLPNVDSQLHLIFQHFLR